MAVPQQVVSGGATLSNQRYIQWRILDFPVRDASTYYLQNICRKMYGNERNCKMRVPNGPLELKDSLPRLTSKTYGFFTLPDIETDT